MGQTRFVVSCVCVLLVSAVVACANKTEADASKIETDTRFEENKSLFTSVGTADRLILYEGLPHQYWEAEQLAQEQANKETVTLHGFPFYRVPLEISAEDAGKLKSLLESESSFLQWCGEKKCGGFHPDYCAEFHAGSAVYRALICFGCSETKVYGPDKSLRCDIQKEAEKQLEEVLKKYRKNRPPSRE